LKQRERHGPVLARPPQYPAATLRQPPMWTDCYSAISAAAAKLRAMSFTLDGGAVVVGADGVAVFDALHRRHKASEVILYAFDLLELDGEDLRALPLGARKAKLARLLG
jgi:bifunctional non-homologous end joining protein LigD